MSRASRGIGSPALPAWNKACGKFPMFLSKSPHQTPTNSAYLGELHRWFGVSVFGTVIALSENGKDV